MGGSVRDFLLKREPKDHDLATDAHPDRVCELFPNAITVGKAFGVIKIPVVGAPGDVLEITTFREDQEYKDHRHPQSVVFSNPLEDARRRDFTVNALFYDPKTMRVLDSVDGIEDLRARCIRAIGVPEVRFEEDALRLMRAIRFTISLRFDLELKTLEALKKKARLIKQVSSERIRGEFNLILADPMAHVGLRLLSETGILAHVFPEFEALKGIPQPSVQDPKRDVWQSTLKMIELLNRHYPIKPGAKAQEGYALRWAVLLHDSGKPAAGRRNQLKNYNGHEADGMKIAESVCRRFKMSLVDIEAVCWMISEHLKFKEVFHMREATLLRWIQEPLFPRLLALHHVDALASDGNLAYFEFCQQRLQEVENVASPVQLVDGKDLIQLGLEPGPGFAKILKTIEDLALEKKISSKQEALEYIIQKLVK